MERETAGRRRSVDVFGQGPKSGTALADGLHNLQKVFEGPGQSVVFGDDHNVTVAELVQHPVQFWPVALRSADLVGK